jgi:heme iron utilization protein
MADHDHAAKKIPSHAERCRTLAASARSATLSTIARDPDGYPYGSLVTVAFDGSGRPLFLLSRLAEHTQNLLHRADASLLIAEPIARETQPLSVGRVTVLGPCRAVPEADRAGARVSFLAAHADAATYVDFADFGFYRLDPIALRYVGGFGRMSWVTALDYLAAESDPLVGMAEGVLTHMNDDHGDSVLAYARVLAGIANATSATMTAVDRYGFDLAIATPDGPKTARLAFEAPVTTSDEVRKAMISLVRSARNPA